MKNGLWVCKSVYVKKKEGKGVRFFFLLLLLMTQWWYLSPGHFLKFQVWVSERRNDMAVCYHPSAPPQSWYCHAASGQTEWMPPLSPPSPPQRLVLRLHLLCARAPPSVPDKLCARCPQTSLGLGGGR